MDILFSVKTQIKKKMQVLLNYMYISYLDYLVNGKRKIGSYIKNQVIQDEKMKKKNARPNVKTIFPVQVMSIICYMII